MFALNPDLPEAENQIGLITKTSAYGGESTKFFFSFVFSSFRAFVIIHFTISHFLCDHLGFSSSIAFATIAEAFIPYFCIMVPPGAEAPKRLIPMTAPWPPT